MDKSDEICVLKPKLNFMYGHERNLYISTKLRIYYIYDDYDDDFF